MTLTQRLGYGYYNLKTHTIDNKDIFCFIGVILFIRTFLVSWYLIPSMSMNPTFKEGDIVIATKTNYNIEVPFTDIVFQLGKPKHGDVINFFHNDVRFVKRVLAVGGDTISMKDNKFYLNGKPFKLKKTSTSAVRNKEYLAQEKYDYTEFKELHPNGKEYNIMYSSGFTQRYTDLLIMDFDDFTVPDGTYFMIGDNRNLSKDSRFIGVVEHKDISSKNQYVLVNIYDIWNYLTGNLKSIRFLEKVI
jgi:signal peptidase I